MIADLNNPVSVRYTEIALESWSKQDILDIEVTQCYTPDTIADLEPLYNWQPLLHGMQRGKMSTKSERAGDISHWQLIKKRAESRERFYVMEHDSYLLDADEFKRQYDFTMRHGLAYSNSGLFMSCYTLSKSAAVYLNDLLVNQAFPLNGGPFGCMERMIKTYLQYNRDKWNEFNWMIHHPQPPHVSVGRKPSELFEAYNKPAESSRFKLASTQVVSKSFGITQEHVMREEKKKEPWERHNAFKIID